MAYKTRVLVTDNVIQYYIYDKPIMHNYQAKRSDYDKSLYGEKTQKSLNRARDNLIMTIEANKTKYTKFITLTCKDNIYDRYTFLQMFNTFKIQFKREFGYSLKYIGVLEQQFKRQARFNTPEAVWHIHLIVFNPRKLEFKRLKTIWGKYGSLDVKRIDDDGNMSIYLGKYLTKEMIEKNKKAILKSQNLKSPLLSTCFDKLEPPKDFTYHSSYLFYTNDTKNATEQDLNFCNFYEIRLNKILK